MKPRRRLERLEAAAASKRQSETLAVRVRWVNAAGETLELGDPIADAKVSLTLDGSKPEAPAWLGDDAGGLQPHGELAEATAATLRRPSQRAPRKPDPDDRMCPGGRPDQCGHCATLQAIEYQRQAARAEPRVARGLAFVPGTQWRRSLECGMR